MKKVLLLLALLSSTSVYAEYSKREVSTIEAGFESLQWLQFLHAVSKKCNDYEYAELAPRSELDALVNSKLKISLEKLEVLSDENETNIITLYNAVNNVQCERINANVYLSDIYDKYDVAKFSFELYEPISTPIMTEREIAHSNEDALKAYLISKTAEAETIMIAELVLFESIPDEYKARYKDVIQKPKYIYKVVKGWKKSFPYRYVKPPISFATSNDKSHEEIIKKQGKTTVLIFIKSQESSFIKNRMIGSINLDVFDVDIRFLKESEWEWIGKKLIDSSKISAI